MPHDGRWPRRLFAMACFALCIYEPWAVFVRETPALAIEGAHQDRVADFGRGARVAQAFQISGDGMNAIDLLFAADAPATLVVRCSLTRADDGGVFDLGPAYTWLATIRQAPGEAWRRVAFPPIASSNRTGYLFTIQLIEIATGDAGTLRPIDAAQPPDSSRAALVASKENILGGGSLWVEERRQVGSLFLRAFTTDRTAYGLFRARVLPALPPVLRPTAIHLLLAMAYQLALATVAYALVIGRDGASGW